MDIQKLQKNVEKEDKKEFCVFLMDLEKDEILKLSDNEYAKLMKLIKLFSPKVSDIIALKEYIFNEGLEAITEANEYKKVLKNSLLARFYFDCAINLSVEKDLNYASAMMNKGISLSRLADWGEESEKNLRESPIN